MLGRTETRVTKILRGVRNFFPAIIFWFKMMWLWHVRFSTGSWNGKDKS